MAIPGTGASQELLRALSDEFNRKSSNINVVIPETTGSKGGVKAVLAGEAALGRVARRPTQTESDRGLKYVEFARSPIVFITNPNVHGVEDLTNEQIIDIYAGDTRRWSDLGGPERKIYAVSRDGGTLLAQVRSFITGFDDDSEAKLKRAFSIVEAVRLVEKHPYTIGFASLSLARAHRVKVLKLNGVEPTEEHLRDGSYPLAVPYGLVYAAGLNGPAEEFISFIKSPVGDEIIRSFGAFPTN